LAKKDLFYSAACSAWKKRYMGKINAEMGPCACVQKANWYSNKLNDLRGSHILSCVKVFLRMYVPQDETLRLWMPTNSADKCIVTPGNQRKRKMYCCPG